MKMSVVGVVAGLGMALASTAFGQAAAQPAAVELKAGDQAPDFELPGSDGKMHKLSDYRGRTVVLAWFPVAFSGG